MLSDEAEHTAHHLPRARCPPSQASPRAPWTAAQLETEFTDLYRNLLVDLRGRLGPKGLIVVIQPGPGENPANQKVAEIVHALQSGGDRQLYELQFPTLQLTGCDFHTNLSDYRLMGATLVKFIEDRGGAVLHGTSSSNYSRSRNN
jgi:hypothetical protein